ncbi:MAG: hypothetical protein JWL59_710 [Chthoniobacteraceae bacterium]|nr:hypothetical protein [Chthoniobacteraceae bacterium]
MVNKLPAYNESDIKCNVNSSWKAVGFKHGSSGRCDQPRWRPRYKQYTHRAQIFHPSDLLLMKTIQYRQITAIMSLAALVWCAPIAVGETVTSTTTSLGTVSEVSPEMLVIRSSTEAAPVRYRYSKTTTYVDEAGAPVSLEMVRAGLPVTVYYAQSGDEMIASKVVVRKQVAVSAPVAAPAVTQEQTTVTTQPPVERQTTTSTEVVEKSDRKRAVIERAAVRPAPPVRKVEVIEAAPRKVEVIEAAPRKVEVIEPVVVEKKTKTTITETK